MSSRFNLFVLLFTFVLFSNCIVFSQFSSSSNDESRDYFTVYQNGDGFIVKPGKDLSGIAYAAYSNDMNTTGWGYLSLTSSKSYSDNVQAAGSGYLEGYITQSMIWQNWYNMYFNEYSLTISQDVQNFMNDNIEYMQQQVQANPTDPFWIHVGLTMTQLNSMIDGYNNATTDSNQYLSIMAFMLMNSDGDMIDIGPALNLTSGGSSDVSYISVKEKLSIWIRKTGHCSSLIKLSDDLSDLYSGHTTWSSYYEMVRMFKIYTFAYSSTPVASNTVMFSSYPASLSSIDDFYLLDSKLVVIETTNGIIQPNNPLYLLIKPQSVLSWIRVIIANRLTGNGLDWCDTFSIENSGSYNNQWIIVDYNKFEPYNNLKDGALFILEQIPGYVEYADQTPILRTGYWPSYNIPFYEYIYNISGFNDTAQYGNWFSYVAGPRAQIFRRDANNVHDFQEFKDIMRYNDWQHDPLALGNAGNQISSRFDLVQENDPNNQYLDPGAFGGIDSKAVNYFQVDQMIVSAQSGPTHDDEKPFDWNQNNEQWKAITHIGMPDVWDFDWVQFYANSEN